MKNGKNNPELVGFKQKIHLNQTKFGFFKKFIFFTF